MQDINAGIDGLPETDLSGKLTRYAALAYKSRIALQAYAYTKDEGYLTECINAANEVIESNQYALIQTMRTCSCSMVKDDKEIILNRQYLKLNTTVENFNEMISVVPNVKMMK